MKYRKLSETGDYVVGSGDDFYADNAEAVGQAVRTRLLLFTDEWFLNPDDGTPWLRDILGRIPAESYDAVIRDRILQTDGVNQLQEYSSNLNREARELTISATITTDYGTTTVQVGV